MKHNNSKKNTKLKNFPKESIETSYKTIKGLLSFNFKYLDQTQGQKFSDLTVEQFTKIIEKLKWYSSENQQHWERERIGNNNSTVLAIYGDFPKKTKTAFSHPSYIPAGVCWARIRLEGDMRLIGFVINKNDVEQLGLDSDIFYIVFLDLKHQFYKSDK